MEAVKEVIPGLPTSYLTNSHGFEVEGEKYSSKLPVYHTADGELSVMRWRFGWKERMRLLLSRPSGYMRRIPILISVADMLSKRVDCAYPEDPALVNGSCFYRARSGNLNGQYVLPELRIGLLEMSRFIFTGDLWQVLKNINGRFVPVRLSVRIPVSTEEEIRQRQMYSCIGVMMAGNGMVPSGGEAVMGEIIRNSGKYTIKNYPLAGEFNTENEAVAWLSSRLRETFNRQWSSAKDVLSHAGYPEYPTLTCPKCDVALLGTYGDSGYPAGGFYACPKCHERY